MWEKLQLLVSADNTSILPINWTVLQVFSFRAFLPHKLQDGTINLPPEKRHDSISVKWKPVFFFVADYLLVGQLCANLKSDRSFLLCLKVTQRSTSEIGYAPLYNSCSLPIQVMTTGPFPTSSKCKSGRFKAWGHSSTHRTTLRTATVMVFGVVSRRATSCHLKSPKSAWKSTLKCTWIYWRVWWFPGEIRWPVADPGCGNRTRRRPTSPKKSRLDFRRSATTLYHSLTGPPPPRTWTRWSSSFCHTSRTSPVWLPTTLNPAWSPRSAEYSQSSRRRFWKRHAPSSGSVSRRRLKLKVATSNRCQLYYIMKLPELIFSIKVLK